MSSDAEIAEDVAVDAYVALNAGRYEEASAAALVSIAMSLSTVTRIIERDRGDA